MIPLDDIRWTRKMHGGRSGIFLCHLPAHSWTYNQITLDEVVRCHSALELDAVACGIENEVALYCKLHYLVTEMDASRVGVIDRAVLYVGIPGWPRVQHSDAVLPIDVRLAAFGHFNVRNLQVAVVSAGFAPHHDLGSESFSFVGVHSLDNNVAG